MSGINLDMLLSMRSSGVRNYAIPGLTSSLIKTVRLFECSRSHEEPIVPHSHRFDFQCLVLEGTVRNRIWRRSVNGEGDVYAATELLYSGEGPGCYTGRGECSTSRYTRVDFIHGPGDWYSMKHHEVHSIFFERGTKVLFFEGPTVADRSLILEPYVDDQVIPTFEVKPWMFKKEDV